MASESSEARKKGVRRRKTAGPFKGVRMRKWGKWVSEIRVPNSNARIWLGSYETPEKAARAYDAALFCLKGAKGNFNFPDDKRPPVRGGSFGLNLKDEVQEVAAKFASGSCISNLSSPSPTASISSPEMPIATPMKSSGRVVPNFRKSQELLMNSFMNPPERVVTTFMNPPVVPVTTFMNPSNKPITTFTNPPEPVLPRMLFTTFRNPPPMIPPKALFQPNMPVTAFMNPPEVPVTETFLTTFLKPPQVPVIVDKIGSTCKVCGSHLVNDPSEPDDFSPDSFLLDEPLEPDSTLPVADERRVM